MSAKVTSITSRTIGIAQSTRRRTKAASDTVEWDDRGRPWLDARKNDVRAGATVPRTPFAGS
jgi:hypothetical protein